MDVSNTKALQLYSQQNTTISVNNTKTFTNMSTNTNVKSTCQYNTKTFTNISTNTSTKSSICIYMDTNKDIEKFFKLATTLMPILPLRLTSLLIDVDIKLVSILSAVTMLVLTFALL